MKQSDKNFGWVIVIAALVLIPVAGVVSYYPYLDTPFIFDDVHTIRDNPYIRSGINPLYFFENPQTASRIPTTLIRPLLTWSYALDYHRAGPAPLAFRHTNLGIHIINALLIFFLTRMAGRLKPAAFACGLLFVLLPLHSVEVAYISNRSTLLSSTFYLAALIAFVRGWSGSDRDRFRGFWVLFWIVLSVVFLTAGLFVKSVAVTLPAAAVLWHLAFRDRDAEQGRSQLLYTFASLLALGLVFCLYFYYRHYFSAPVFFPPARPWPVWQYAAAQVQVFWTYARLMFWPVHLSLEHEAWVPASPESLICAAFIIPASALFALVALSLGYLRKVPEVSFAVLFSLVYLLPTSSVVPLVVLVNENRPYLSSLLFVWPLLFLFVNAKTWKGIPAALSLIAILFMLATLLVERGKDYRNDVYIWRDAVKNAPGLARPHINLGVALSTYGRSYEARARFESALEIEPCNGSALTNLGNISWREGKWEQAENLYRKAMECDPDSVLAIINLAEVLMDTGRGPQGAKMLEGALALNPNDSLVLGRLGVWLAYKGEDPNRGILYLEKAAEFAASETEAALWLNEKYKIKAREDGR